jgi:heme-degrading monooxygenase HmoA
MIERHVTFEVLPDQTARFESFFKEEYRPAMSKSPGFIAVGLLAQKDNPARYQMIIRFESQTDADAWRASEAHKTLSPRLKSLYSASQVTVYEPVA